jgi:hypothetical protein
MSPAWSQEPARRSGSSPVDIAIATSMGCGLWHPSSVVGPSSSAAQSGRTTQQPERITGLLGGRPAWRAPRPRSWPPALPPHRVPIQPPPIGGSAPAPSGRVNAGVAAAGSGSANDVRPPTGTPSPTVAVPPALSAPLESKSFALDPTGAGASAAYLAVPGPGGVLDDTSPTLPGHRRNLDSVPATSPRRDQNRDELPWALPGRYVHASAGAWSRAEGRRRLDEDADLLDEDLVPLDADFFLARRSRGIAWFLVLVATVTGGLFLAGMVRPDVIAGLVASVQSYVGPTRHEYPPTMVPPPPPLATGPRVVATPAQAKTSSGAEPEPPLVSVWSLPIARAGLPASPIPAFHVPAAPRPPHALFVPSPVSASVVAPKPMVAPMDGTSPRALGRGRSVNAAPPLATATAQRVAAPAPGSLEDKIRKAVEAEAGKK